MAISKNQPMRPALKDVLDVLDFIDPESSERAYETVADMQADATLTTGMIVHTLGFHAAGDGGAAYYEISNTGTANGMDVIACGDLFANLVVTQRITPEMIGATKNDCGNEINYAISQYGKCFLDNDDYYTDETIVIENNSAILECLGSLHYTGIEQAILIKEQHVKIDINKLFSYGIGIELLAFSNKAIWGCIVNVNLIRAVKHGIFLNANSYGVNFNSFSGNNIVANVRDWEDTGDNSYDAIHIEVGNVNTWCAQNSFYNFGLRGKYGYYFINQNSGVVYGNNLINCQFEKCAVGDIYLNKNGSVFFDVAFDGDSNPFTFLNSSGVSKIIANGLVKPNWNSIDYDSFNSQGIIKIEGRIISGSGNNISPAVEVTKYGIFDRNTKYPGRFTSTVTTFPNAPNNDGKTYGNIFYIYGGFSETSATIKLPAYIGDDTYGNRISDFVFNCAARGNLLDLTIQDNDGNAIDTLTSSNGLQSNTSTHYYWTSYGWCKK